MIIFQRASQATLVIKNLPANAGSIRDAGMPPKSMRKTFLGNRLGEGALKEVTTEGS